MQTFVVRVHRSEDRADLRGIVEEVSSGVKATFHNSTELLSILTRRLEANERPQLRLTTPGTHARSEESHT